MELPAPSAPRSDAARPHVLILSVCSFIIATALVLSLPGGRASTVTIGGVPIPAVCYLKRSTGLSCPGCGLTRSIVAAAHGDWKSSLYHHRLGLLVFTYLVGQSTLRLAWLGLPSWRRGRGPLGMGLTGACQLMDRGLIVLMVLVALNWLPTLFGALSPSVGSQS